MWGRSPHLWRGDWGQSPTYEGGTGGQSPPAWKYPILWQVQLCFLWFFLHFTTYLPHPKPPYPISTLPEHLHSTFPSHAKLPENTLTEKKNIPFPSLTLITCLTGPPVTPPLFTGRPSHTLSYTIILFLALKVNGRFLESLPVVTFASLELKLPVFSFH